jgi:hypothetical protein
LIEASTGQTSRLFLRTNRAKALKARETRRDRFEPGKCRSDSNVFWTRFYRQEHIEFLPELEGIAESRDSVAEKSVERCGHGPHADDRPHCNQHGDQDIFNQILTFVTRQEALQSETEFPESRLHKDYLLANCR